MASRSKLYTRFRSPHTHETEDSTKIINLVSLDIDESNLIMDNKNIQLKFYTTDEVDACTDYVTSGIKNVYLFLSSDVSNRFIPLISNCEQIESIYILHKNEQYQDYFDSKEKVRDIFYDIDKMIKQFQEDINTLDNKIFLEHSTFKNINPESAEILWWKIFDKILQHIQHTNIAKDEFIEFARGFYPDNKSILRQIEEFQNSYTSDRALYWYTCDSFLFRLLNRTLRTQNNLNNLFKLRLFLTDLISGFKTAQAESDNNLHFPLTVYRGMLIRSKKDLQQWKSAVGNSIFFNEFLSTSTNYQIAEIFAGGSSDNRFEVYSAILTLEIDSISVGTDRPSFANISELSYYHDEQEVLISMHSTFLVQSMVLLENNLCNIRLKFIDNLSNINFGERSIFSSSADQIFIRNLPEENTQFIAFQVLLDTLLRLDQNEYSKQELLQFARSKYHHNPEQLRKIDDFEQNYQSEDAAKWYTKDSFLYRILNESLRTETIDSIVKMRYFIHDLHNQLAQLQTTFIESLNGENNLTLYRGQPMKKNKLDEINDNIGGLISMNSFLSATQNRNVAIIFSGADQPTEPDEVSVIYEMLIDTNIRSTPYARIESVMGDEEEILFSMGSVFRIGNVDELRDRVYSIKLTMEHIEDELWNKLTAHLD